MILIEQEFYDYKTAPVVGNKVVDLHRTGISYYDDFISNNQKTLDYLRREKNLVGEVIMMSPEEYYQACSDYAFSNHPSVESLKQQRRQDVKTLEHLKRVLLTYKRRFPMPMLNKADLGQEGLHRMMVIGDMFGWDYKVPVLVVDWADKQRAYENAKRQRIDRIEYNIKRAVKDALMYKFSNIEELREQIQWELDKQFDYNDDGIKIPVEFELTSDEESKTFIVSIGAASYDFDYDDVKFIDYTSDESDSFDMDDLELDDIEDFLKRHFGDDWRETDPHLKDTFNIKESIEKSTIDQMDNLIQSTFASDNPGEGCIFIAPNGKFINIYPKLDDHEDLCYWLEELEDYDFDTPEEAEWFVTDFGYVRCRNSLHLCFIEVPEKMTSAQYSSLEEWLETKVTTDSIQIEAWSGEWKTYNLDDYFPEDIIKLIKRSYASGKLYEGLK